MRRIHPHHGLSDVVNGFWSFTLSWHGVCLGSCGLLVRVVVFSSLGGFLVWTVCFSLLALHVSLDALEVDAGFQGDVGGRWRRGSGGGDGGGGGGGSARRARGSWARARGGCGAEAPRVYRLIGFFRGFFGGPFGSSCFPFCFGCVSACVPFWGFPLFEGAGCECPSLVVFYSSFYLGVGVLEPFSFYAKGEGVNVFRGAVWAGVDSELCASGRERAQLNTDPFLPV